MAPDNRFSIQVTARSFTPNLPYPLHLESCAAIPGNSLYHYEDMIIGGTNTTVTTMEWEMTELLRHPDKLRRMIDELEVVVGNQNVVEESHLPRLLYLEAVVKATFRFHPPAPSLVPYMASETTVVAGYTIPMA